MTNKQRPASEITEGLRDWSDNRRADSADALLKLVYTELHRQAYRYLQKERVGHTLQTTALVNEAYLKLIEQKSVVWKAVRTSTPLPGDTMKSRRAYQDFFAFWKDADTDITILIEAKTGIREVKVRIDDIKISNPSEK